MAFILLRPLTPALLWLLGLMGAWMLFVVSTQLPELALGAGSAVAAAAFALLPRQVAGAHAPPRLRWLAGAARLIPRLFTDTAVVFVALSRQLLRRQPATGAFRAVAYRGEQPDEVSAAAADAFLIAANSITPNTIVVDIDRVEGLVLLHQLAPESPAQVRRQLVRPR
jgi:multisubunit Na+/H+ antiporter MnhE subunit